MRALHQQPHRVFKQRLDLVEELRAFRAVADAVIYADRRAHDRAHADRPIFQHNRLLRRRTNRQNTGFRRVDDRREVLDVERAEVADAEGAVYHILSADLPLPRAGDHVAVLRGQRAQRGLVGVPRDHIHQPATGQRNRDPDVDAVVAHELVAVEVRIQVRVRTQRQRSRLDDQVVDGDLAGLVGHAGVELLAQFQQFRHVDRRRDVEVRDVQLALDHTLADALTQAADVDHLDVRAGWQLANARAGQLDRRGNFRRALGRRRGGRCGLEVLDVPLDDPTARASALDLAQVDPALVGDAARDRAGLDEAIPFRNRLACGRARFGQTFGGLRTAFALVLILNRAGRAFWLGGRGDLFRFLLARRGCRSGGGGLLSVFGDLLAFLADIGDRRANGDPVARLGEQLQDRAACLRFDLDGRFVGLDFRDDVT